jgi:lipopolysaccharide/colanic/teichoic acid biosynthesis glycosyltransferase
LKKIFDILVSLIGIIIVSPIFVIVSILILLEDGGQILFIQERIGKNGKKFRILKFRTMSVLKSGKKGSFDLGDTSRITRIGKILRKTKIDEMPQLINVFLGQMSFVGPRPEVENWVVQYPDRWKVVHQVKPGITDNASIEFRNEEEILSKSKNPYVTYMEEILPRKLTLYEEYVRTHTFLGDIKIILKTMGAIITK